MPISEEARRRLPDDLERTRRELGSSADYSGTWRICLFQCELEGDEFAVRRLDVADAPTADDEAAAAAASELRTTVLFEASGETGAAPGSVLATPILDPLILDPSPLQQFVLGVVTFASGINVSTWTNRYELQVIANKYAERLARGIIGA